MMLNLHRLTFKHLMNLYSVFSVDIKNMCKQMGNHQINYNNILMFNLKILTEALKMKKER